MAGPLSAVVGPTANCAAATQLAPSDWARKLQSLAMPVLSRMEMGWFRRFLGPQPESWRAMAWSVGAEGALPLWCLRQLGPRRFTTALVPRASSKGESPRSEALHRSKRIHPPSNYPIGLPEPYSPSLPCPLRSYMCVRLYEPTSFRHPKQKKSKTGRNSCKNYCVWQLHPHLLLLHRHRRNIPACILNASIFTASRIQHIQLLLRTYNYSVMLHSSHQG